MTVNIVEHFETEFRRHSEERAAWEKSLAGLRDAVKAHAAEFEGLEAERKELVALAERTRAMRLDATPITPKIEEVDARCAAAKSRLDEATCEVERASQFPCRDYNDALKLASILKDHLDCPEAVEVRGLRECFDQLPLRMLAVDDGGHPAAVRLRVGGRASFNVPIHGAEKRFVPGFVPASLRWVPGLGHSVDRDRADDDARELLAFLDRSTGKLLLSDTKISWSGQHRNGSEYAHERDFSQVAMSLSAVVTELLSRAGTAVEPGRSYPDNELAASVSARLIEMTASAPRFVPRERHLTSEEIQEELKGDWGAFVNCPWSANVTHHLALLKYLVENHERPRFWSGPFDGQYGYRVRTRDHSWITGEIYVDHSGPAPDPAARMNLPESYSSYSCIVATLGRLSLMVKPPARDE